MKAFFTLGCLLATASFSSLAQTGNVGIGTTMPNAPLQFKNDTSTRKIVLYELANNNHQFYGFGINDYTLRYQVDAPASSHVFYSGDGSSAPTELMRITGDGRVGVGSPTPQYTLDVVKNIPSGFVARVQNSSGGITGDALLIRAGSNTGGVAHYIRFTRPDGTIMGSVAQGSASTVNYYTSSDRRLKESIRPTAFGLPDLMKIEVSDYVYKSDSAKTLHTGFIAQDLYTIFPNAVEHGSDADESRPWSVDYGKLTPLLVKAVQDQQAEIENLRAGIKALSEENKVLKADASDYIELAQEVRDLQQLLGVKAKTAYRKVDKR